jgi:hypothetical protein
MTETNYRQLDRKATTQHYGTILFKRLNGESVKTIASSLKMEEASVQRCLAWAEKTWARIISPEVAAAEKTNAPQLSADDLMAKTCCAKCKDTIEVNEYRVVVSVHEMRLDFESGGIPHRSSTFLKSFCDTCSAEMTSLELPNFRKLMIESHARDASESSPPSEDAFHHSVSGRGGEDNGESEEGENEPGLNHADKESIEFSDHVGPGQAAVKGTVPLVVQTVEAIRRDTLRKFLKDSKSRGTMKQTMRDAVALYVDGTSQSEIARKLKVDQGTVSRMIKGALQLAGAAS